MSQLTPINDIPMPELADPPNISTSIQPAVLAMDTLLVSRFTNTSSRDAKIVTPTGGQICWVTGDSCYYVYNGADWLKMHGAQIGTESISFSSVASFTATVSFPVAFINLPVVTTNINSGSGSTSQWHSRAINITNSSFQIFVFATSSGTWSNIPVQWSAIGF